MQHVDIIVLRLGCGRHDANKDTCVLVYVYWLFAHTRAYACVHMRVCVQTHREATSDRFQIFLCFE